MTLTVSAGLNELREGARAVRRVVKKPAGGVKLASAPRTC